MSYMKDVAKLLGVELGEEFKVDLDGVVYRKNFYFTEYSLFAVGDDTPAVGVLNNILNGEYKVIKLSEPVLDKKEKEYLSTVLKPFRNEIECIYKCATYRGKKEYIAISFKKITRDMFFPEYPTGTMYKGVILNKEYSLDDLGL